MLWCSYDIRQLKAKNTWKYDKQSSARATNSNVMAVANLTSIDAYDISTFSKESTNEIRRYVWYGQLIGWHGKWQNVIFSNNLFFCNDRNIPFSYLHSTKYFGNEALQLKKKWPNKQNRTKTYNPSELANQLLAQLYVVASGVRNKIVMINFKSWRTE